MAGSKRKSGWMESFQLRIDTYMASYQVYMFLNVHELHAAGVKKS